MATLEAASATTTAEPAVSGLIVVGVDGSPASLNGLTWALGEASRTGARVQAVMAWGDPAQYTGYALSAGVDFQGDARGTIDEAMRTTLGEADAKVSSSVLQGHAAQVLLTAAEGADLLVVGSRGHGEIAGMVLGSVSEYVITHATCPVLVMPHPRAS